MHRLLEHSDRDSYSCLPNSPAPSIYLCFILYRLVIVIVVVLSIFGFPVLLQVLNGQAWVMVDGAILDVSAFAGRHPGGARVIRNAMGTDVTNQLLGQAISVDPRHVRLSPHTHSEVRRCVS